MQQRPKQKKQSLTNNAIAAANVSQTALPKLAEPDTPLTEFTRDLTRKKRTISKINADVATLDAIPDIQELKHVIDISRICASNPKMAERAERPNATMWRTRT